MNTIILGKKKFVVIEQEKFEELQLEAARKTKPVKKCLLLKESSLLTSLLKAGDLIK